MDKARNISSFPYGLPKLELILALALFTLTNLVYVTNRSDFFNSDASPVAAYLSLSLLSGGAILLSLSGLSYLRITCREAPAVDPKTSKVHVKIGKIIADSFFENRKVVAIAFVLYAAFFSFVDGILIYQPSVDFFEAYGVKGVQAISSACCGFPGFVPSVSIYFPAQHAGMLVIPLNILLMVLLSSLVSLNVTLLYRAASLSRTMKNNGKGSLGVVGAISGLFAGCPTCAAAFFLSIIAGTGATAFSIYISQYQILIIALTLPLLLGSIYWQAKSIRILIEGCSV
ncbi:MAG: hypothetical protein ACYC7D_06005 [Nitrososphaerales archaeon]